MKEWSLYAIRDKALALGRAVYSTRQLANLVGKPLPVARVYASRLVEKGLAHRLRKGLLAFSSDEFVVATQLVEPSYVSLDSALLFHGLIQQVPKNIECVTAKDSLSFPALGLSYHKVPPALFGGYRKHAKGLSYVFVAEPEKAVIDGLYLHVYSEKNLGEWREKLDAGKLLAFAKRFRGKGAKRLRRVV